MDLETITTSDFKVLFRRDFPYLPTFSLTKLYNSGTIVYYETSDLFYKCNTNGTVGVLPTVTDNWDLDDSTTQDDYVLDEDIEQAFSEATVNLNTELFSNDAQIKLGYLYLSAHYMVHDLRAMKGGIESNASMPVVSRSVGRVSESYAIPQKYLDSPVLSFYTTTAYGLKFLSLIVPNLSGNVGIVAGGTNP